MASNNNTLQISLAN